MNTPTNDVVTIRATSIETLVLLVLLYISSPSRVARARHPRQRRLKESLRKSCGTPPMLSMTTTTMTALGGIGAVFQLGISLCCEFACQRHSHNQSTGAVV